jgi:hypothetical protein
MLPLFFLHLSRPRMPLSYPLGLICVLCVRVRVPQVEVLHSDTAAGEKAREVEALEAALRDERDLSAALQDKLLEAQVHPHPHTHTPTHTPHIGWTTQGQPS